MENYVNFGELERAPFVRMWKEWDRVTPLFLIFVVSFVMLIVGTYWPFLSLFAWIGGLVFIFMVAVGIALFSNYK